MNNHQKLIPVEPIKKLKYNEIGVKSDLKGNEIKNLIDKVIFILIYKNYPNVTLKSRGKGTSKLISIIDILRRKILGLYVQQKTYSTIYKNELNKEIRIPSMDAIFLLRQPQDNNISFLPPKNKEELEENFIDPRNPPDFRTIRGNNNNNNNNINNYSNNQKNYNNNNCNHYNQNNNNYNNYNNSYKNYNNNNFMNNNIQRGRGKKINRGNEYKHVFRGRFNKNEKNYNTGINFMNYNNNNNKIQLNEKGMKKINKNNNNSNIKYNSNWGDLSDDYTDFKGSYDDDYDNFNKTFDNTYSNNASNKNFNNNFNNNQNNDNNDENNFYDFSNYNINDYYYSEQNKNYNNQYDNNNISNNSNYDIMSFKSFDSVIEGSKNSEGDENFKNKNKRI